MAFVATPLLHTRRIDTITVARRPTCDTGVVIWQARGLHCEDGQRAMKVSTREMIEFVL
jgi:hypothetical protein